MYKGVVGSYSTPGPHCPSLLMVGEGGGGSVGGNRELFYPGSPLSLSVNGRGRGGGQ